MPQNENEAEQAREKCRKEIAELRKLREEIKAKTEADRKKKLAAVIR